MYLANLSTMLPYIVRLENGSKVINVFGADPAEGFILAYVDGKTEIIDNSTRFRLKSFKPERIYCKFTLINPNTGEEVK